MYSKAEKIKENKTLRLSSAVPFIIVYENFGKEEKCIIVYWSVKITKFAKTETASAKINQPPWQFINTCKKS